MALLWRQAFVAFDARDMIDDRWGLKVGRDELNIRM